MEISWHNRGQYANMVKDVLASQIKCYNKEPDNIKKTKIAQSIGYLGQIINSLINSQEDSGIKPEEPETEEISEPIIKEFVRNQILEETRGELNKNCILHGIINFKKCDMNYATLMFKKMEELGLKVCLYITYDLMKFAKMRGYLSPEEIESYDKRWREKRDGISR